MARKTPQQTNILIHLALWGLGVPALFVAMGIGFCALNNAPGYAVLTVSVVAAIVGLFVGIPFGIISYFVVRGARGWGRYFDDRRAEQAAEKEAVFTEQIEDQIANHLMQSGTLPASDDPWNGTNPYGCCQNNYDADGNLSHGSPDCLHPLIVEQRAAS